jgi:hypothetical protein
MTVTASLIKHRSTLLLVLVAMTLLTIGEIVLLGRVSIYPSRAVLGLVAVPSLVGFAAFAGLWWLQIQRRPIVGAWAKLAVLEKAWFWVGSLVFIAIEAFYYVHFVFGIL